MNENEKVIVDDNAAAESMDNKGKKKRSSLFYWIRDIAIALVIAAILLQFINPTTVRQDSMMNTLNDGDYIFINKQAYNLGKVKHGDIIVFQTEDVDENGREKKLIKRAIALPGETIEIADGEVYVNDEKLDEPYIREPYTDGNIERTVVPDNTVFAMGDNRAYSHDSRESDIGFISMDKLKGKAIFRIYPFGDIGTLK